jgi:hypothetical protein
MGESARHGEFRDRVTAARRGRAVEWEATRALLVPANFPDTIRRLRAKIAGTPLGDDVRGALLNALRDDADRVQALPADALKVWTGLPASKGVRALCLLFGVAPASREAPVTGWSQEEIAAFVERERNPFELLAAVDVPSVLDLGAGDLSFAAELVERYLPRARASGRELLLHALDRIDPSSALGGPLQADPALVARLRATDGLQFRFWPNQDMFAPTADVRLRSRYTLVVCMAPATPTFAYEPSRFSAGRIHEELRRTKGEFRRVRVDGEDALEVMHGGRRLLFPPWKFDIRGPLALLDLISRRGHACVLGAVDGQVFWEILSQLIEDPAARAPDVVLSPARIEALAGPFRRLAELPVGASIRLADLMPLRQALPRVMGPHPGDHLYRFRYVEIRRGATFNDMPAGKTARLFTTMTEEPPPWWLLLIPEA